MAIPHQLSHKVILGYMHENVVHFNIILGQFDGELVMKTSDKIDRL